MKLFGKKKETKTCCCGGNCTSETMENTESKKQEKGIKILGSGCIKCMELEKTARTAISELQLDYEIDHVTDFVTYFNTAVTKPGQNGSEFEVHHKYHS